MIQVPDSFWKAKLNTERRYFKAINQFSLILRKALKTKQSIEDIFSFLESFSASPVWQEYSHREALSMVETINVQNASSWRDAAKKSSRGNEIYQLLRKEFDNNEAYNTTIQTNAAMIKSLPADVAEKVSSFAANSAIAGKRSDEVLKEIKRLAPELSEKRAKLIARTEVSKAQSAITENRAERLGLRWYIWHGALDERERKSHKHLEGVACQFADPPNPEALAGEKSYGAYNAGQTFYCRCYAAPIVDASFPKFPLKCVINGRIVSLSEAEFKKVY